MAMDLTTIFEALTGQVSAAIVASRPTTVRPYRTPTTRPCITLHENDITQFVTSGPNGYAEIRAELKVWVSAADPDSEEVAMRAYLSSGTGNGASIADAVNADPTLGGVVDSCVVLEIGAPSDEGDDYVAVFPLKILTKKVGAQA